MLRHKDSSFVQKTKLLVQFFTSFKKEDRQKRRELITNNRPCLFPYLHIIIGDNLLIALISFISSIDSLECPFPIRVILLDHVDGRCRCTQDSYFASLNRQSFDARDQDA